MNGFVTDFKAKENSIVVLNNEKMGESVHLIGCISIIEKGRKFKYWGSLETERNGSEEWIFGSLPVVNPTKLGGGPRPC